MSRCTHADNGGSGKAAGWESGGASKQWRKQVVLAIGGGGMETHRAYAVREDVGGGARAAVPCRAAPHRLLHCNPQSHGAIANRTCRAHKHVRSAGAGGEGEGEGEGEAASPHQLRHGLVLRRRR